MFFSRSTVYSLVALATFGMSDASDFAWRMYSQTDCNHDDPTISTFPINSQGPNPGTFGQCLSAPTGVNWQRVEVDTSSHTIYTFCDVNCGGGESGGQGGTYCAGPASGCAIGSFIVV